MSRAYRSPDTRPIDKRVDGAVLGARDVRLEPITTIPTDPASAITGPDGVVQTDVAGSVFNSILSVASTDTGLVSAIGGSPTPASTGLPTGTTTSSPVFVTTSRTLASNGDTGTSAATSASVGGTTSNTAVTTTSPSNSAPTGPAVPASVVEKG
ncbi:MAG: hypothetical protein Q9220_006250 [cf. Caloplaca sp. 1 TL-2023]